MANLQQRAWLSWATMVLLALLCGVLAILQYRWIGEITGAQKSRMREAVVSRMNSLSRAFNDQVSDTSRSLFPAPARLEQLGIQQAYEEQYSRVKGSVDRLFHRIALAVPENETVQLYSLNSETARFAKAEWPADWKTLQDRLMARRQGSDPRSLPTPPSTLLTFPRFEFEPEGGPPAEREWLIVDLNLDYVRSALLPDLLNRYLSEDGKLDYHAEVVVNSDPSTVIFDSKHSNAQNAGTMPDASVLLLDVGPPGRGPGSGNPPPGGRRGRPPEFGDRGPGPPNRGRGGPQDFGPPEGRGGGPPDGGRDFGPPDGRRGGPPEGGRGPGPPAGPRWRLEVWHIAGSLDALVAQTRTRNLAVSGGILVLILAAMTMLLRFSRRADQLAEQQMNFIAGVSHELRTPVTVIRTAAFNLRGKLAGNPDQVERYGALIQTESEKLTALVDQVLRFSSANAGQVIREREPVAMEALIDAGIRSSQAALEGHQEGDKIMLEKNIEAGLPLVLADEIAMRHALQNLMENAVKYGAGDSRWIGISASAVTDSKGGPVVEIRIADHGPGIPADEQARVFDPFFRGRKAIQDQVHGTGLGLSLVKKIVEAHGGTIRINSAPMQGVEFIVRIPACAAEVAG